MCALNPREVCITWAAFQDWPADTQIPKRSDADTDPRKINDKLRSGYWKGGQYWVTRIMPTGIVQGKTRAPEIRLKEPLARTRCRDCRRWSALVKDKNGNWYDAGVCQFHRWHNIDGNHNNLEEVTLGEHGTYSSVLPKKLREKLQETLDNPEAKTAAEELALCKAMLAGYLEKKGSERDADTGENGLERAESFAAVLKISKTIAEIAATQAIMDKQRDGSLEMRQVLVLLDAAVSAIITHLGVKADQRTVLLTILPELPWPQGVARVHGSEGLIGKKGQLLLPKPPAQRKDQEVTAAWPALADSYRKDVAPIVDAVIIGGETRDPQMHGDGLHFLAVDLPDREVNAEREF